LDLIVETAARRWHWRPLSVCGLERFAWFDECVSDRRLMRQSGAGPLIGAPWDVAVARPGGGEVIAFEPVIDPCV
jgi:hypothetical protein